MTRHARAATAALAGALVALNAMASCGDRTGLPAEEVSDAGNERPLLSPDRFAPEEAELEAMTEKDVASEIPGIDTSRPDVVVLLSCPDAAATLIYVISKTNVLYSFNPAASSSPFTIIGSISCPGSVGQPFSMAVDREGIAYVIFSSYGAPQEGTGLFRVSTKTADCKPTKYDAAKNGEYVFGMGFVAGAGDGGSGEAGEEEQLFLSLDVNGINSNGELSTLDTTTFDVSRIAFFNPTPLLAAELTGTGDGRLFAFSPAESDGGTSTIDQVDPATAEVIGSDTLPGIVAGEGWAFGFWGGDFYTFTTASTTSATTLVNRFDPVSKTITLVATLADTIVGAGVSTCAPQN